jgi:glycosyltransferase involved in cell wall biosynthesis
VKFAPEMLVLHSAYTFQSIKKLGLEVFVTSRDASHTFKSILTVNPVASLQLPKGDPGIYSSAISYILDDRNRLLEGTVSRFRILAIFPRLNFFLGQVSCFITLITNYDLRNVKLVRAEDARFNGLWAWLISRLLGKPLLIGIWGNPGRIREETKKPLMPRLFKTPKQEEGLERFVLKRANLVIGQNQENLNYAISLGVLESKIRTMRLGVGLHESHYKQKKDRFDVAPDLEGFGLKNHLILVCISRLEDLKNVNEVIKALVYLDNVKLEYKLLIVGDGSQLENLSKLALQVGVSDKVLFLGARSQAWIAGLLSLSDIAIAPLTGRALLEIGLAGCPVVAYDVDWHSELVKTHETGILVENLDTRALGNAIEFLLLNQELRKLYGKNIRKLAMEMASPQNQFLNQMSIYKELI